MPETSEIIAEVRHFDKGFRFLCHQCGNAESQIVNNLSLLAGIHQISAHIQFQGRIFCLNGFVLRLGDGPQGAVLTVAVQIDQAIVPVLGVSKARKTGAQGIKACVNDVLAYVAC